MHVSLAHQIECSRLYTQKESETQLHSGEKQVLGFTAYLWCKIGIAENHFLDV